MKRIPRIIKPEKKLMSSARRVLASYKSDNRVLPINNSIFDFHNYVPRRKPPESEVSLGLLTEEKKIPYRWTQDGGSFRTELSWDISEKFGGYSAITMGKGLFSLVTLVGYIWQAQQKRQPEWLGTVIYLPGGQDPYIFNHDSVMFLNRDLLRKVYDIEDPTASQLFQFDRLLASLFSLRKVIQIKDGKGHWRGQNFSRVIHQLIYGTRYSSETRIIELSPQYQLPSKRFILLPNETEEARKKRLEKPPYWTKVSMTDIALESKFTSAEAALYDYRWRRGNENNYFDGQKWRVVRFCRQVLHYSDSYIDYLKKKQMLISHLRNFLEGLKGKLEEEGETLGFDFRVLPKHHENQKEVSRVIQFFEPEYS